jgi:TIR domain
MADIFLSYASTDRERIHPLVTILEEQGWSVWLDRKIPPGKTWHQVIQQALDEPNAWLSSGRRNLSKLNNINQGCEEIEKEPVVLGLENQRS